MPSEIVIFKIPQEEISMSRYTETNVKIFRTKIIHIDSE
jgi:hypothetical protein